MERAILHCDLNNFYASVECRDFPHLKGKAVAVCGRQEERHGIVLAKNELAKKYGAVSYTHLEHIDIKRFMKHGEICLQAMYDMIMEP